MSDHHDHVHVGYTPQYGPGAKDSKPMEVLEPDQWRRLIGRIAEIDNPKVPTSPSRYSLPSNKRDGNGKRASNAHKGE